MRNQILYASVIFSITALLIGTGMFTADARETTVDTTTKGNGVTITSSDDLSLTVYPNPDSKDFTVAYQALVKLDGVDYLESGRCTQVTDKVVKIASLKKASIEFNTNELGQCGAFGPFPYAGLAIDISVKINETGDVQTQPIENEDNGCKDGVCSVTNGYRESAFGTASISIDGVEKDDAINSEIFKINTKETHWNQ